MLNLPPQHEQSGTGIQQKIYHQELTDTEYTTSGIARYGSDAQKLAHGVQAETIGAPWTVRVELRYRVGEGI